MSYVLRRFFGWAKQRRLVLADPTRPLRLGGQPGFVGTLLDVASQGQLINRWTSPATHPHERLTGLFALMHAASNAEIRALTLADIDDTRRAVQLHRRPFKTELDPITWPCLQDSLRTEATCTHSIRMSSSRRSPGPGTVSPTPPTFQGFSQWPTRHTCNLSTNSDRSTCHRLDQNSSRWHSE